MKEKKEFFRKAVAKAGFELKNDAFSFSKNYPQLEFYNCF